MDSEQLVCNPYQDLQNEAIDSVKKVSFTEKLTSVKNNVCEHQLKTKARYIDRERQHKLRNLHIDYNNLRYEVKLMDIKKRRNTLEIQKRIQPQKDFSYDTRQISNTEKRLGVCTEESHYLYKKQKFPLRGNIVRDHNAKPIIKTARRSMHDYTVTKKKEKEEKEAKENEERATTAQTMSTAVNIISTPPSRQERYHSNRRGSKSAPPLAQTSAEKSRPRTSYLDEKNEEKLPSIQSRVGTGNRNNSKSHVKFLVQEPVHFTQPTPQGTLERAKTYHPGMKITRAHSESFWDSDSDDDYSLSEKIDLRALFFGNKTQNGQTRNSFPNGATTPRTLTRLSTDVPILSRSLPSRPTEEQIKQESENLREKIDSFLGYKHKSEAEIESEKREKESKKEKEKEKAKAKEAKEKKAAEELEKVEVGNDAVSKALTYLRIFSKPVDPQLQWGFMAPSNMKMEEKQEVVSELSDEDKRSVEEQKAKKMWEYIKTEVNNGNAKRKYSANALLLQQLTGILIEKDKKHVIPTHAASRALRHTPTFKMRRVVEEVMKQRTRFEQQEVERLQKKDAYGEGGMYGAGGANEEGVVQPIQTGVPVLPTRAWATPTRQLEQES